MEILGKIKIKVGIIMIERRNVPAIFLETALKLDPIDKTLWVIKGNSLHILKKYEDAIPCYETALKLVLRT